MYNVSFQSYLVRLLVEHLRCRMLFTPSSSLVEQASTYITLTLPGFIYPVVVHWTWSDDDWLTHGNGQHGYRDFAGSGVVHLTGGMAALVGAVMLGPRQSRIDRKTKKFVPVPPHSVPLTAMGGLVIFIGMFDVIVIGF